MTTQSTLEKLSALQDTVYTLTEALVSRREEIIECQNSLILIAMRIEDDLHDLNQAETTIEELLQ